MIFSNNRTTNDALLNTLGDELAAAWVRFYAIEVDSRPGELEYDRALAAAKKLEAAVARDRRSRWRTAWGRPAILTGVTRFDGSAREKARAKEGGIASLVYGFVIASALPPCRDRRRDFSRRLPPQRREASWSLDGAPASSASESRALRTSPYSDQ